MQFSELIKYVASIKNKKDLIISFNQEQIIITTIRVHNSFYIVKENKTNIINKIIPNHSINSLVKLSKLIKLENYEIKVEEFNNKFTLNLIQNTSSFTFDLVDDFYEYESKNDLKDYNYCGSLDKIQINELLNKRKLLKFDEFRDDLDYYEIKNNYAYISDSYIITQFPVNLKNCLIDYKVLYNFKNENNVEVYINEKDGVLKSGLLEKKFQLRKLLYSYIYNKIESQILTFKIKNTFGKLKNNHKITFDFNNKEIRIINTNNTKINITHKIDCIQLDYEISFASENFNKLNSKENDYLEFRLINKDNYGIYINNSLIFPLKSEFKTNNIDFTPENITELQNKIDAFESLESKQAAPVTKQKSMKKDKPNLKIEKTVKVLKSKYSEVINEVVEVVNEVENEVINEVKILDAAPEIKENIKEIRPENIKKLTPVKAKKEVKKVEFSNTIVDDNFDFMEFIFIHCITDLERLKFHNLNLNQKRLYLEDFEFTFNEINSNQIEVIELTANNESKIHNLSKKEVLQLIRNRVEECI